MQWYKIFDGHDYILVFADSIVDAISKGVKYPVRHETALKNASLISSPWNEPCLEKNAREAWIYSMLEQHGFDVIHVTNMLNEEVCFAFERSSDGVFLRPDGYVRTPKFAHHFGAGIEFIVRLIARDEINLLNEKMQALQSAADDLLSLFEKDLAIKAVHDVNREQEEQNEAYDDIKFFDIVRQDANCVLQSMFADFKISECWGEQEFDNAVRQVVKNNLTREYEPIPG